MKRLLILTLLALFSVAGFVGGSFAGHGHHSYGMKMNEMSELDSNNDNSITFDEFSAPTVERLKSGFKMLDTNNDEVISKEEWDEFLRVHGYEAPSKGSS